MTDGRKKSKSIVALENEEEMTMHILALRTRRPVFVNMRNFYDVKRLDDKGVFCSLLRTDSSMTVKAVVRVST
jgi:hypothetical protein